MIEHNATNGEDLGSFAESYNSSSSTSNVNVTNTELEISTDIVDASVENDAGDGGPPFVTSKTGLIFNPDRMEPDRVYPSTIGGKTAYFILKNGRLQCLVLNEDDEA